MSKMDETVPGGLYLDAQGVYRDAWGNKVEPQTAAQPDKPLAEQEAKSPTQEKKKKAKEVTDDEQ